MIGVKKPCTVNFWNIKKWFVSGFSLLVFHALMTPYFFSFYTTQQSQTLRDAKDGERPRLRRPIEQNGGIRSTLARTAWEKPTGAGVKKNRRILRLNPVGKVPYGGVWLNSVNSCNKPERLYPDEDWEIKGFILPPIFDRQESRFWTFMKYR